MKILADKIISLKIGLLPLAFLLGISIFLIGCQASPQPINYGTDGCHFCKMTIVDKTHAAEIVTKKGKVYKFDATECMINSSKDFNIAEIKLYLSNNYNKPEDLIDATQATFLISKNVPSPMGAYLSAFESRAEAESVKSQKTGDLFTWEELLKQFE